MALSGLTLQDLWLNYMAVSGSQEACDLAAYLAGETAWTAFEHNKAALALNEACYDQGYGNPATYV